MRESLQMSKRERDQVYFLRQLTSGAITAAQTARALKITERHVYRLKHRFLEQGEAGLVHRLCGRSSNRRYCEPFRRRVVEIYRSRFSDYGPTLFVEKLVEYYGIALDQETTRRWLMQAGLWQRARKGRRHRKKRKRREEIGAMTQVDGSHHDWFEGRGDHCCLFVYIDDASNRCMLYFAPSEDTEHGLRSLRQYAETYGLMQSIYCDRGSVFGNPDEDTSFKIAAAKLGIKMIYANSPEAKGRVERSNRTHQDRLIKALREHQINDIESANQFLQETYMEHHNAIFSNSEGLVDIHRPVENLDLDNIICLETERSVNKDMTFRLNARYYQIIIGAGLLPVPRQRVTIRHWLDGSMHVFWKNREIAFELCEERPMKKKYPYPGPSPDHPWRHKPPIGKANTKGL